MAAPTKDSCIPSHQQAGFDCENGTSSVQRPFGKSEPCRRKQCVICCSVATAFCAAGLIGFFILGPLVKQIVPCSKVGNDSHGNTALAASTSFMSPSDRVARLGSPRRIPVQRATPVKAYGDGTGAAVLERQRVPPAPPPAGPNGGGGDNGDGGNSLVRLIGTEQQAQILGDWIAQTRLYKMSSQFGGDEAVTRRHEEALKALEELSKFKTTKGIETGTHTLYHSDGLRMLFALYDHKERVVGIAAMGVNDKGLTLRRIAINPTEVNNEDSVASLRVVLALRLVAQSMKVPLDDASLNLSHGTVAVPSNFDVEDGRGVEKDVFADK